MMNSRRDFLKTSAAATAALLANQLLAAKKRSKDFLDLPVGLQLYSVRTLLPTDFAGTLKQVAGAGYQEVEAAGFYNKSASEVKADMQAAGLRLVSAHYGYDALMQQFDQNIAFGKELGLEYIVCASPGRKDKTRRNAQGRPLPMTIEDWQWNAEQFNDIGKKIQAAGMKFGYHNHYAEYIKLDGGTPMLELLKLTDPKYVTFEMDCGWVVVGGGNPVEMLETYPTRFTMLHVKDFKDAAGSTPGPGKPGPKAAELGQGSIDYHPIFKAAAKNGNMTHCFVEQEEFLDLPAIQALKVDADYMHDLRA